MKMFFIPLSIIFLLSCNNESNTLNQSKKANDEKDRVIGCDSLKSFALLVQQSIDIPDLQQYYGVQKTLSQKDFIIQKNKLISSGIDVYKLSNKVSILTKEEINKRGIKAYIEFKEIDINHDTAHIELEYPVQGLGCEAVFIYQPQNKDSCYWKLLNKKIYEY